MECGMFEDILGPESTPDKILYCAGGCGKFVTLTPEGLMKSVVKWTCFACCDKEIYNV
jgi:hypothetical protein